MEQAKYEQVEIYLREYIRKAELKYGDVMPTENEMMKMFGVSRHTIRRALSDLVNQGWLYKKRGSGTYVADPNADTSISGRMIGVVTTYFRDYIFTDILSGMDDVFSDNGYSILLGTTKNSSVREREVLNNMLNNRLAGLIVEPSKSVFPNQNIHLYEAFRDRGIPVLFIHATYRGFETSFVVEDDEFAGYIATRHLTELGHRRILGIFKQDDMQGHGRYRGYLKALEEVGVSADAGTVKWFTTETSSAVTSEEAVSKWADKDNGYTAIVCYNDQIAIRLISTFKTMGVKVPDDYSLVSFDDSSLAGKLDTGLTTVAHPKAELGKKAAQLMLEMIKDPKRHLEEVMKPELIIRDTTRKL